MIVWLYGLVRPQKLPIAYAKIVKRTRIIFFQSPEIDVQGRQGDNPQELIGQYDLTNHPAKGTGDFLL